MRDFVGRHGIQDVVFAGFMNQSEISRAYAAADIFALVSGWHETWGLVVNEAMNFDLPVVVSDKVGCAADLVHHAENGYVFPHDRPDELARYLTLLITDPARRALFGQRAAETIAPLNDDVAADGDCRGGSRSRGRAEMDRERAGLRSKRSTPRSSWRAAER